jgi:competence protein ComFB
MDKLNEVKDSLDCCRCEHCMLDIATYVLNRLPPKYVATTKGDVFSRLDVLSTQYTASILMLIVEASQVIRANPGHPQA